MLRPYPVYNDPLTINAANNRFYHNKCSDCRMAAHCLPAQLDVQTLQNLPQLTFKSHILEPGEHLSYQGDLTTHLYTLRSGILKSYITHEDGDEQVMGFHFAPDLFGWEGIDEDQLSMSIIALDYSNVCEISINKFSELATQHPPLQNQLFYMVSRRIRHHNYTVMNTSAQQRVAQFILRLSSQHALTGQRQHHFSLAMTHQDIANYLRIKPETISRIFRLFKKNKVIRITRKEICIRNPEALKTLANGKMLITF